MAAANAAKSSASRSSNIFPNMGFSRASGMSPRIRDTCMAIRTTSPVLLSIFFLHGPRLLRRRSKPVRHRRICAFVVEADRKANAQPFRRRRRFLAEAACGVSVWPTFHRSFQRAVFPAGGAEPVSVITCFHRISKSAAG
jgi:hypothetical protein